MAHGEGEITATVRRLGKVVLDHPVPVVAVVASARAVWDVARVRPLGAYPVDDAGFMATSLALHREATVSGLGAAAGSVLAVPGGPLVPAFDVIALAHWGRGATALAVVPALGLAVSAVLVAAITTRLASRSAALVAGLVAVGLPSAVLAGRSHQVVVLAAPALLLAVWALLVSDHGRRPLPMLLCGAAVGAAVLARPMMVAYIPGLALATGLLVARTRRGALGVGLATAMACALVAPWVLRSGGPVTDYLLGHGYGADAEAFGPSAPALRVAVRILLTAVDLRVGLGAIALVTWVVAGREASRRGLLRRLPSTPRGRAVMSVWLIVASGYLALLTTANAGLWFELPLELLGVAATVGLAPLLGRWRRPLALAAVASAFVMVLGMGWLWAPHVVVIDNDGDEVTLDAFLFADPWVTGMVEVDPAWRRPRADVAGGAARWWDAHRQVVRAVVEEGGSVGTVGVVGSSAPMNRNSLLLAGELGDVPLQHMVSADSAATIRDRVDVVVVVQARGEVLPGESEGGPTRAELERLGWEVVRDVPLPDGGVAGVLVPPGT